MRIVKAIRNHETNTVDVSYYYKGKEVTETLSIHEVKNEKNPQTKKMYRRSLYLPRHWGDMDGD